LKRPAQQGLQSQCELWQPERSKQLHLPQRPHLEIDSSGWTPWTIQPQGHYSAPYQLDETCALE